jgi:hypothetical protein
MLFFVLVVSIFWRRPIPIFAAVIALESLRLAFVRAACESPSFQLLEQSFFRILRSR